MSSDFLKKKKTSNIGHTQTQGSREPRSAAALDAGVCRWVLIS